MGAVSVRTCSGRESGTGTLSVRCEERWNIVVKHISTNFEAEDWKLQM